jgi:hypothetical protein
MKDARLLKILVEEKALVKLLKTIGAGKAYPTRENHHLELPFNCYI